MRKTILLILFSSFLTRSFSQGINFMAPEWQSLLANAKKTNKLIFVDVYTDWCGNCKQMDKAIFTQKSVGSFYNSNFINTRIDAEKGIGLELAKKYSVGSYPTYLFVNGSGTLIYKNNAGYQEQAEFIITGTKALQALHEKVPLSKLDEEYKSGNRNKEFLFEYLNRQTIELSECDPAVLEVYLSSLSDQELTENKNLLLIALTPNAFKYNSKYFLAGLNNLGKIENILSREKFFDLTMAYMFNIANNGFFPNYLGAKNNKVYDQFMKDYNTLYAYLDQNDPFSDTTHFALIYQTAAKDTARFKTAANAFTQKWLYSTKYNSVPEEDKANFQARMAGELQLIARGYYQLFDDEKNLVYALKLVDTAMTIKETPTIYLTKARLLMKLSRNAEAVEAVKDGRALAIQNNMDEKRLKDFDDLLAEALKAAGK